MARQDDCELGRGKEGKDARTVAVFCVCFAVVGGIVLAAHWPGLSARALMLDDDQYLVENRLVQNPSWTSAKRFFAEVSKPSTVRGYYQPLSMISLMLDCAMGGSVDNLRPFHRTSLALHIANSLLVIVFLYLLFGRAVPAAMAGLLYGVHPITIESVAWISERKTVLAAFFALWCLVFYLLYVRRRNRLTGVICLLMYVLSLLSKPGVIGMPVLLLLLDYWPLKRFGKKAVLEKLPLFIIGGLAAVVTFISQSRAASVTMPGQSGLAHVIFVFCHNIVFYLYNFIWPANLSWYYPFPKPFDLSQPMVLAGVVGTCVLIPALLISLRWTKCVLVGWLFFFVSIFPTLGVIGIHPMIAADRHMYFPMVGLLLPIGCLFALFWGGEPVKNFGKVARQSIVIIAVLLLTVSGFALTRRYLVHWRDSESVYEYMLGFSPGVVVLHNNFGNVLKDSGKFDDAVEHFNKSLELKPNSPEVHNNLGTLLDKLGRFDEAVEHYKRALELRPNFSQAHYNLATLLAKQGRTDEAVAEFRRALGGRPDNIDILSNMAFALAQQGKLSEATEYYKKALAIEPDNVVIHGRLGLALAGLGRLDEAIREFQIVLNARPDDAEMHFNLGVLLERQGKIAEAIKHYRIALQLKPNEPKVRRHLNDALSKSKINR
ncbi:MAG: tetratricopeptide repeat protein [Planctomycetota bacterium]|nr:MAG: tetratricopeptide repeat protein [Planctomycetota bacterium]